MRSTNNFPARVTLSCPEKGGVARKLVLLPHSLQELLDIGAKRFAISPTKVLTKEGAEIEDIELIRDGDYLLLVSETGSEKFHMAEELGSISGSRSGTYTSNNW